MKRCDRYRKKMDILITLEQTMNCTQQMSSAFLMQDRVHHPEWGTKPYTHRERALDSTQEKI